MPVLIPPVDAPIVRHFDYRAPSFAAGQHRGLDFAARAGEAVAAPCGGRVAYAGATPQGRAVTLACGSWRITLLPVSSAVAARGDAVAPGALVARATTAPLHLGVRRGGDAFGYVDPELLLDHASPPLGPAPAPALGGDRRRRSPDRPARRLAPRPRPAAGALPVAGGAAVPATAPWPAFLGAALALAGATGGAARTRRRRARRRLEPATEAVTG